MREAVPGTVYLVGAGPGDPELLTVRARRLLDSADVVMHDSLVHEDLLASIPESARLVDIGKRPGPDGERTTHTGGCKFVKIFEPPWGRNSSVSYSHQYQEEIHDLLVETASESLPASRDARWRRCRGPGGHRRLRRFT